MGLSRLLKNEWVIYVKSFVLHGHNDAHATNSLFTSNLYIFPYKLVGKLSSQSYNDYDDYEGESSFDTLNKFWWHIVLPNNIPTSTYFLCRKCCIWMELGGEGYAMLVCHCQNPVVQYLELDLT